jgi:heme-degrading monooxygenase HmoA
VVTAPRAVRSLLLAGALAGPLAAQQPALPPTEDVALIDAIIHAVYAAISGPAGPRDWDQFRSLFAPGARLIPVRETPQGAKAVVLDVEAYIERVGAYFEAHGFFEHELARRTEQFGNVAHAFSTYASYHAAQDTAPFSRGINSFQLLRDGPRWWIVTVFWDAERTGLAIPPAYLPAR